MPYFQTATLILNPEDVKFLVQGTFVHIHTRVACCSPTVEELGRTLLARDFHQ